MSYVPRQNIEDLQDDVIYVFKLNEGSQIGRVTARFKSIGICKGSLGVSVTTLGGKTLFIPASVIVSFTRKE